MANGCGIRSSLPMRPPASHKARLANVLGVEPWVKVRDAAPIDRDTGLRFLGLDASMSSVAVWAGADGPKTSQCMVRWVDSKREKGPWSETASARIGAQARCRVHATRRLAMAGRPPRQAAAAGDVMRQQGAAAYDAQSR